MPTHRDVALHILNSIEHQGRRQHRVYLPMAGNVPSEFCSTIIHLDVQLASDLWIFLFERSSYRLLDLLVGNGRSEGNVILDLSLRDRLRCP
jgi:hypothetical protein